MKQNRISTTMKTYRTRKIIDKLVSGDVNMEFMEKLAERRIKIKVSNGSSAPGGRNL